MRRSICGCMAAVMFLFYVPEGLAMRSMSFLEKFDLSELTYVRLNTQSGSCRKATWAVVLDPERLPHYVRRGDYLGRHFGLVTRITSKFIEVKELFEDSSGEWVERSARLPLVSSAGPRSRFGYEQDRALWALRQTDTSGRQLSERLIECRKLFGKNGERLACFDAAVGTLLP